MCLQCNHKNYHRYVTKGLQQIHLFENNCKTEVHRDEVIMNAGP